MLEKIYLNFINQLALNVGGYFFNVYVKNLSIYIDTSHTFFYFLIFFLKNHMFSKFNLLVDIFVIDNPKNLKRFSLVYSFLSIKYNLRLFLKIQTFEIFKVKSISYIFNSANWIEREIWDMFGIFFANHPDLRKLLTDYNFVGFPLKKEFPLWGDISLKFNLLRNRILYHKLTHEKDGE